MKKKYEKPQVYIERFELAEHIAGCSLTLNAADVVNCTASGTVSSEYFGSNYSNAWFIEKNTTCEIDLEGYCYTNGNMNVATINS